MKRSRTFPMPWRVLAAVLAGTAAAAATSASFGQAALAPAETRNALPTLFLSGPDGDRFTLVRSAGDGWHLAGPQTHERPLSVFIDGPTGITFIYVLDEGWKFAGRVVDRAP